MALINCIECTKPISDLAETCPQCGAPVELSKIVKEETPKTKCFECETILKDNERSCPNCGVNQTLNSKSAPPLKETSKNEAPKERIIIQQMPKKSKWLRNLIILLSISFGLAFIWLNLIPHNSKRELFKELGIENSEFVGSNSMASYVKINDVITRKTLFGKWGITFTLSNLHIDKTIYNITFKVKFSDGNKRISRNMTLRSQNILPKIIDLKIEGHKNASFQGIEIIDAN